jgi:hypothetical protein
MEISFLPSAVKIDKKYKNIACVGSRRLDVSMFLCTRYGVDDVLWLISSSFSKFHRISAFECLPNEARDERNVNELFIVVDGELSAFPPPAKCRFLF